MPALGDGAKGLARRLHIAIMRAGSMHHVTTMQAATNAMLTTGPYTLATYDLLRCATGK